MSREAYIQALLSLYCGLPDTAARRASLPDRRLATHLFDRGISLMVIETALLLAVARRSTRDPELPPLPPIRSLAYFLPVVEELRRDPPDPGYLGYLRLRRDRMVNFSTDRGER
jgi:hypothetical protein